MNKPFNLEAALAGAEVVTRDGRRVGKVVAFSGVEGFCVAASVFPSSKMEDARVHLYQCDGTWTMHSEERALDLFMVSKKQVRWANVYSPWTPNLHEVIVLYDSEAKADANAAKDRVACVKVEWEEL